MIEAPLILVVEDDYPLQGVVEDFLREGGFVPSYRFVAGPVRMSDQTD